MDKTTHCSSQTKDKFTVVVLVQMVKQVGDGQTDSWEIYKNMSVSLMSVRHVMFYLNARHCGIIKTECINCNI